MYIRLDKIIFNSKQRWNEDKCRCKCKELVDKDVCNKGYFFNPSNCECKCDKSCGFGEYLDYSNCKCKKKLFDKWIEECKENIDVIKIDNENEHKKECSSCIVYIVFFSIFFTISIVFGIYFVYSHWNYQLNIKNNTYYFYDDIVDIKNFQSKLIKIDKKPYKDFDIYYFGYITTTKIW